MVEQWPSIGWRGGPKGLASARGGCVTGPAGPNSGAANNGQTTVNFRRSKAVETWSETVKSGQQPLRPRRSSQARLAPSRPVPGRGGGSTTCQTAKQWSTVVKKWSKKWSNSGQTVIKQWSNSGLQWSNSGQTVVKSGLTVVKQWSNSSQTVVKQ